MPDKETLKLWVPNADFTMWWKKGSLTDQEKKRIVMTKVPISWQEELRRVDVAHSIRNTKSTEELVDYFTTLEALERHKRQRGRRTTAGRVPMRVNTGRYVPNNYRGRNVPQGALYYNGRNVQGQNNNGRNVPGRMSEGRVARIKQVEDLALIA
jgi:hypothetical protein